MAIIDVSGVGKSYGGRSVLTDVSFSVAAGEIFGVLGPNGAGKTTTVEIVSGLRRPDTGRVRVLGLDPHADGAAVRERIGVQLQETRLPDNLKVWEALDLYASFYRRPADWAALLRTWGLEALRERRIGRLSGGQRQRLFIALALVGDPEVVFLDELTTGLDPAARRSTWTFIERIRNGGVTVVLISHFMDEIEALCDRVAVIGAGRVVAVDTPARLVDRAAGTTTMTFVPQGGRIDRAGQDALITAIPLVEGVSREGDTVTVTGRGDVAAAVATALAGRGVALSGLRVASASLDEAFARLTTLGEGDRS